MQKRNARHCWRAFPLRLKDLTPTKGIRTTRGSLVYKDWVPDFDAPIVERLYAAGGVMLGKTNTPEMGWKGDSGTALLVQRTTRGSLAAQPVDQAGAQRR